jgi:hypothetical protein
MEAGRPIMSLGPDDIARRIQHQRRGWLVWYGRKTTQYWALACWTRAPHSMLGAATPDALDAAMATFASLYPKPAHSHAHALVD